MIKRIKYCPELALQRVHRQYLSSRVELAGTDVNCDPPVVPVQRPLEARTSQLMAGTDHPLYRHPVHISPLANQPADHLEALPLGMPQPIKQNRLDARGGCTQMTKHADCRDIVMLVARHHTVQRHMHRVALLA